MEEKLIGVYASIVASATWILLDGLKMLAKNVYNKMNPDSQSNKINRLLKSTAIGEHHNEEAINHLTDIKNKVNDIINLAVKHAGNDSELKHDIEQLNSILTDIRVALAGLK